MYYIIFIMKNNILKLIEYFYYLSLALLFLLYLFPGSLIGYFLYGDLLIQPQLIDNPIGTSINHYLYFTYLAMLAFICNLKNKFFFTQFRFIFFVSIFLEIMHFIIPNRAFEFYDLIANIAGVVTIILIKKIFK